MPTNYKKLWPNIFVVLYFEPTKYFIPSYYPESIRKFTMLLYVSVLQTKIGSHIIKSCYNELNCLFFCSVTEI